MSWKRGLLLLVVATVAPLAAHAEVNAANGQLLDFVNYSSEPQWQASFVNAAMCRGEATLQLEWNLGQTPPANATTYQLLASNVQPATTAGSGTVLCRTTNDTNASPPVAAGQISEGVQTTPIQRNTAVSGAGAVSMAGFSCDGNSELQVLYVCAHLLLGATPVLSATGKFIIQTQAPDAPVGVNVTSLQGCLGVSWTPPSTGATVDHYVALAYPVGADDLPVPGDTLATAPTRSTFAQFYPVPDGQRYRVTVVAYSIGGNPSAESAAVFGTPAPVLPGVPLVRSRGGGCGTGGAGALSLIALAALARAARRRK